MLRNPRGVAELLGLVAVLALTPAYGQPQEKPASAREPSTVSQAPHDLAVVDEAFGRKGEWKPEEGVYLTSFPRSDLSVQIGGEPVPTALGFGSWVAFKEGTGDAVAMSDMVLLPDEVSSVISALQANDIEVTALHRHFQHESPAIMYLHSHATGDPAKVAAGYREALDKTATPLGPPAPPNPKGPELDASAVASTVGRQGEAKGGVYKITVGRDDLHVRVDKIEVTKSMGLNSWAAFVGTDAKAHVAGDIAMLDGEVNPVVRALRANRIEVVSIHNHMLGDEPRVIFLHDWGSGPAQDLARAFKAALDELGKG